jgi:hypothetical protein
MAVIAFDSDTNRRIRAKPTSEAGELSFYLRDFKSNPQRS